MNFILNFEVRHTHNLAIKGEKAKEFKMKSYAPENFRDYTG
jgi:hypothetical protein